MDFNTLLSHSGIDQRSVVIFRHRPFEPELKKVLPWLAEEKPDVFNAYQQTQGDRVEQALKKLSGSGYVASFIGHEAGRAIFVGLYKVDGFHSMSREEFWEVPAYQEMKKFGFSGFQEDDSRKSILWFDLEPVGFYPEWKGRLIIDWPPPERSWWRRAHRNDMSVSAILQDSAFVESMPHWTDMVLSWPEIAVLPARWRQTLAQWRGIYLIYDRADGKGYVGSAGGDENLLGRWLNYSASGHGRNKLLLGRDPLNFDFSILQRVSPDMESGELVRLENSWKARLHTRAPLGLNDN